VDWLKNMPVNTLVKAGWIKKFSDKVQQLQEILNFFGVASPEQWEKRWKGPKVSYRTSKIFQNNPYAISAWLRQGELSAQSIDCNPFDSARFKEALMEVRQLTTKQHDHFQQKIVSLCANAGVAVVFVPEIIGVKASGATWWSNKNKAVIQLSLRYKSDDHLWFSFFHEAGHILLHSKKEVFIDGDSDGLKEEEANRFASDWLIPPKHYRDFLGLNRYSKVAIRQFAAELGIAPGIIVGRLQYDKKLSPSFCNDLKKRLEWAKSV